MYEDGYYQSTSTQPQMETFGVGMLGVIPGSTSYMAYNVGRTRNTFLHGGRRSFRDSTKARGYWSGAVRNNAVVANPVHFFNPRARYGSDDFLRDPGAAKYTPFQLSAMANWAGNKVGGSNRAAKAAADAAADGVTPGVLGRLHNASAAADGKATFFQQGTVGRISASMRVNSMDSARVGRLLGQSGDSIAKSTASGLSNPANVTGRTLSQAMMLQTTGGVGGRVSGFIAGAVKETGNFSQSKANRHLKSLGATDEAAAGYRKAMSYRGATEGAYGRGVRTRNVAFGKGVREGAEIGAGAAAKFGLKRAALGGAKIAAYSARAIPVVGWALMAYDLTRFAAKSTAYAANTVVQAADSATKGLATPIGGRNFIETSASMTSRGRGVMAIQNSRLNARSVLGNEAAAMAGYMG